MMPVIVDDLGKVVERMRVAPLLTPYYMYGHRLEISNRLTEKAADKVYKYTRYPLVALRLDIPEIIENGYSKVKLNIIIATMTDENYNAEERYLNVFKPILYPLYDLFVSKIRTAGLFTWEGPTLLPPHVKIDRPYWGISGGEANVKNIFNDPIDVIEIIDLELNKRIKC